jgi:ribosomal protein S18 acetylase RimI-like enzyme
LLAAAREDPESEVYGLTVKGELVAAYVLKKIPLSLEVTALAVAPAHRRQGHGRACLTDALRRAGKRPLVVETDEAGLPFYKAVGFKVVGRRKGPGGTPRYRLGWHAPRLRPPPLQSVANRPDSPT